MSTRTALLAGTVLSLAAVSAWSWMASLAIGPAAPLHLSRNLLSDYALCLLASGWRQHRRLRRPGGGG